MPIDNSCVTIKDKLEKWLTAIKEKLNNPDCPLTNDQKKEIRVKLDNVVIKCSNTCPPGKAGRTDWEKGEITLCLNNKEPNEVLLFHELVHACGGKDAYELDAEGLENNCYSGNPDHTLPDEGDFKKMVRYSYLWEGCYCGKYIIWNPLTGEKWVNEGTKKNPKRGKPLKPNKSIASEEIEKIKGQIKKDKEEEKKKKGAEKKSEHHFMLSHKYQAKAITETNASKKRLLKDLAASHLKLSIAYSDVARLLATDIN